MLKDIIFLICSKGVMPKIITKTDELHSAFCLWTDDLPSGHDWALKAFFFFYHVEGDMG